MKQTDKVDKFFLTKEERVAYALLVLENLPKDQTCKINADSNNGEISMKIEGYPLAIYMMLGRILARAARALDDLEDIDKITAYIRGAAEVEILRQKVKEEKKDILDF